MKSAQASKLSIAPGVITRLWPALNFCQKFPDEHWPAELIAAAILATRPFQCRAAHPHPAWFREQPRARPAGVTLAKLVIAMSNAGSAANAATGTLATGFARPEIHQWVRSRLCYLPASPFPAAKVRYIGISDYRYLLLSCTSPLCGFYAAPSAQWLAATAIAVHSGYALAPVYQAAADPSALKGSTRRRLS